MPLLWKLKTLLAFFLQPWGTLFVGHTISGLLSVNQIHTSQRMNSVDTWFTQLSYCENTGINAYDWCGKHGVCLHVFVNDWETEMDRTGNRRRPQENNEVTAPACYRPFEELIAIFPSDLGYSMIKFRVSLGNNLCHNTNQNISALLCSSWSLFNLFVFCLIEDSQATEYWASECLYCQLL